MFRRLKSLIVDCVKDRRQKAKAKQVFTLIAIQFLKSNFMLTTCCMYGMFLLQLQEKSVLDLLVVASETEENGLLSDNHILTHCLNFLFAAYDTTSLTLTCVSHLLATNTHVQDKLCALLDDYWSQHQVFFTCTEI